MEKAFSGGKTGKWPEKRRTGKRANEIECPEKGKGKAPNLKSRARYTAPTAEAARIVAAAETARGAEATKLREPYLAAAMTLKALPRKLVFEYLDKYEFRAYIGGGTYGSVYDAVIPETGERVVIKRCAIDPEEGVSTNQLREVSLLKSTSHSNITKLLDVFFSPDSINLVLEHMDGDLCKYLKRFGPLAEGRLRIFFFQIVQGVDYLHAIGILKEANEK